MADLTRLCAALGLDATASRRVLDAAGDGAGSRTPVYIQALLGIGAWIAALLMLAFVLLFLDFIVGVDLEEEASAGVGIGAACFAVAVVMRAFRRGGAFLAQLASALSTAGVATATAAVLIESWSFWTAAAVAGLGTAVAIAEGRDRPTQFASAALALALVIVGFDIDRIPYLVDLFALASLAGVGLTLYPPRRDVAPLAAALLLAPPALMVVVDYGVLAAGADGEGWPARAIGAGLAVALLVLHRRLSRRAASAATTLALAAGLVAACVLLPVGGSAALVLMMLAFVLGLRGLGATAVLFQAYFVARFYYDLQMTLLEKSLILMAAGAVGLGLYALVMWRHRRAAP